MTDSDMLYRLDNRFSSLENLQKLRPSLVYYHFYCPTKITISINIFAEAVARRCSVKKVFLEISQNSLESTCTRVPFLMNVIKKETLAQVFSCEFCKISKSTFSYKTPTVTASLFVSNIILDEISFY